MYGRNCGSGTRPPHKNHRRESTSRKTLYYLGVLRDAALAGSPLYWARQLFEKRDSAIGVVGLWFDNLKIHVYHNKKVQCRGTKVARKVYREGRKARLFPTVSQGEDRATSIFLSVLDSVEPFRRAMMQSINIKLRKRKSTFTTRVHPEFSTRNKSKDIPDGMIILEQDKVWSALIEVKIKKADLDEPQLERYLKRVKEFDCQALITISNEMCATPSMPPLRLVSSDRSLKRIAHYHWSWKYIQNTVRELLSSEAFSNDNEQYILEQFLYFLRDPNSGVLGFTKMNRNWSDFVSKIEIRGTPTQDDYEEIVSDWHQESSEIALILSETMERKVTEVLDFKAPRATEKRLTANVKHLKSTKDLHSEYYIENVKYKLGITIDVNRRLYSISMRHDLPTTVKTPHKRIERFLKSFGLEGQHDGISIFAKWPYMLEPTDTTLFKAIQAAEDGDWEDTGLIVEDKDTIQFIELKLTRAPGKSVFKSATKIISNLEKDIRFFSNHYVHDL